METGIKRKRKKEKKRTCIRYGKGERKRESLWIVEESG